MDQLVCWLCDGPLDPDRGTVFVRSLFGGGLAHSPECASPDGEPTDAGLAAFQRLLDSYPKDMAGLAKLTSRRTS